MCAQTCPENLGLKGSSTWEEIDYVHRDHRIPPHILHILQHLSSLVLPLTCMASPQVTNNVLSWVFPNQDWRGSPCPTRASGAAKTLLRLPESPHARVVDALAEQVRVALDEAAVELPWVAAVYCCRNRSELGRRQNPYRATRLVCYIQAFNSEPM